MNKKYKNKHNRNDNYVPPYDAAVLAEPIDNIGLSAEVVAKLQNGKVNLIMDIVKRTEKDMYKISTFNKKNLFELKRILQNKRLSFRPEPIKPEPVKEGSELKEQPAIPERRQQSTDRRLPQGVASNGGAPQKDRQNLNNRQPSRRDKDAERQNTRQVNKNASGAVAPRADGNAGRADVGRGKGAQEPREDNRQAQKQQNKRIWDSDGITEQRTKDEKEKSRPKRQESAAPRDSYIKINKNDKWGFANRSGKEVVPPIYDEVFMYKEDLCCVEKDGLFGYIDREGVEVIPIEYDCALSFSEGYACVCRNNKCGYINKSNEVIIGFKFEAGTPVIEGNCRVKKDGKWGELYISNPDEIRWIN